MGPNPVPSVVKLSNSFDCLNDEVEVNQTQSNVTNKGTNKECNKSMCSETQPKIINISKVDLNNDEIQILKRGPKFTPTPRQNAGDLKKDVFSFCRKLRLREYFSDVEMVNDESIARNKSTFNPERNRNTTLDTYIDFLKKTVENVGSQPIKAKSNINSKQKESIQRLKNNTDIVFKQADKGGAFVIMDVEFYALKMQDQLKDETKYQMLKHNNDDEIKKKMIKIVKKYENCLTKKEFDFLTNFEHKTSNLYGLPKIHQSKEIEQEVQKGKSEYIHCPAPENLKMRPIIAGPTCPTHRLSNFVDIVLKPLTSKVKSFVRDDLDFLTHLPNELSFESMFVTYDVNSLYTNIPHKDGLLSVKYWIDKYPELIDPRFTSEFLMEAVNFILNNNTFHFDDNYYLQKCGTAMGTKMAPTYATLFMGYLEEKFYTEIEKRFDANVRLYFENNWLRYLDDCFIIWKNEFGEIDELHDILMNLHPAITFKWQTDPNKINFLDITVIKEETNLKTDIFYKVTDTHQ